MPFRIDLWEVEDNRLKAVPSSHLDQERRLEDWLAKDPSISGMDMMIIGRQLRTAFGGRIDLLGIDAQGNTVLLELKRGRTPRDVVAQVLDYATWVKQLDFADLDGFCRAFTGKELATAFSERFDASLPELVNSAHTLVIIAPELDDSSERIVQYLADEGNLAINVVCFNVFGQGGKELLGRAWLRDPEEVEDRREMRRQTPWMGYWFVNVGEGPHRNWDDCRQYGFLSAGQGEKYSRPLKKLPAGSPVFAYMKGRGYVGYGRVVAEAMPIKDFQVDGKPLLELPLKAAKAAENMDDPEWCDWVVGINWEKTTSREEAQTFTGVFANQNIVCKLRHPETVSFLEREFAVKTN